MDADDVAQVVQSLRQALSADPARARHAIDDFGWSELLDEEPKVAVASLFALYGELLIPGSALDRVLVHESGLPVPEDIRVVLPIPAGDTPTSRWTASDSITVDGVVQAGDGPLLVPCLDDATGLSFAICEAVRPADGEALDPAAGWTRVNMTTTAERVVGGSLDESEAPVVWRRMESAGHRALAHELVAIGSAMKTMTVEHVRSREQFGQPLGAFQSVKHQLADVHLWHEVAALSADAAWEDMDQYAAALAKSAAIRFTRTARAVCQQLLGGMGFTWEHDFHRYLRRALTLEPLLGGARVLHTELGAALRIGAIGDSLVAL